MLSNIIGGTNNINESFLSAGSRSRSNRNYCTSEMTDKDQKISEIGVIWNGSNQMRKQNKSFERKITKRLNNLNKTLRGLSNQVKEEISNGKRFHQEIVEANRKETKDRANKKKNRL